MSTPVRSSQGALCIAVRVTPKASLNTITGLHTGSDGQVSLAVKVTAAPDKGKANKAVMEVLSAELGFPKTAFQLARGDTDRHKLFIFSGDGEKLAERLSLLLKGLD